MKAALSIALGATCALLAIGVWLYTPDKDRAGLKAAYGGPSTHYVTVGGIALRVRDTGPATAPVIIMLHGFGSSLETWEGWAERLSGPYRVVRFDLPGFGLTGPDPTGDYSDRRGMDLLEALMDALGVRRAVVVGNSMGGKLAWQFAATHPDRVTKLVLVSPDGFASPGFEYDAKPEVPFVARLLPYVFPRPLVRASLAPAYADPARLTDATVDRYRDLMLAPGVRGAILARMQQVRLEPPGPTLATIKAPTLLLWGEKDAMIPFRNAQDYLHAIPGSRLAALPTLGHVAMEEAPAESLAPVAAFLAEPPP